MERGHNRTISVDEHRTQIPSENKRGGLNCRRQEQQLQSTGRNACGIATTNVGCRRRGKEQKQKSGSCKDEREWGKKCFEDLDQRRMGRPVTRTWSTDFLLREGSSREEIGQWLKNKSIPWQRRRSLLQFVTHPLRSRLVVSRSTCPPLSPSPHAKSFVVGPAVINTHTGAQRMGSRAGDESVLSCQ